MRENDWPQLFKILSDASAAGVSVLRGLHFSIARLFHAARHHRRLFSPFIGQSCSILTLANMRYIQLLVSGLRKSVLFYILR